ncbi:hypothetical protein [Hydrogenophaga sp. OTU3427]|uniref:hypothetical protein n=1 Tax=Hydrogenophaga sp. OTU3427 TaxID=3043856 RepID=UPI00313CA7E6
MSANERGYQLLLVEPSSVVRSIIVSVAKQLDVVSVHQTGNLATANEWLIQRSFDGILLSVDQPGPAMDLLTLIRMGQFRSDQHVPVVALVSPGDKRLAQQLTELDVKRTLPVPFRIREVIDVMRAMLPGRTMLNAR